jgi:hypothetical protein
VNSLDPLGLVDLDSDLPDLSGAVLVHALDGFIDAGSAVSVAREHLLASGDTQVVARFDVDQLFDYRARRPLMQFEADHWQSYDAPELALHLLPDAEDVPYLLLAGPEPDAQWERFVAAVQHVVQRLGVRLTVGMSAFPMSVPHTRPTPVILHGSPSLQLEGHQPWLGSVAVPASIGHLLEFRLGQAGLDAIGVAVPVPPYLSAGRYPAASLALLGEVAARSGLQLPLAALIEDAEKNRAAIDAEVAASTEVQAVVAALEQQYEATFGAERESLLAAGAELPSADELGAELERFLADRSRGDGPTGQ